jgi:hypothetical protein
MTVLMSLMTIAMTRSDVKVMPMPYVTLMGDVGDTTWITTHLRLETSKAKKSTPSRFIDLFEELP